MNQRFCTTPLGLILSNSPVYMVANGIVNTVVDSSHISVSAVYHSVVRARY